MMVSLALFWLCISPPATLKQAAASYRAGDCAAAAALYARLVEFYPERWGLRLNLARCLAGAGRIGDAIAEVGAVVHADPTRWDALRLWWQLRAAAETPPEAGEWLVLLGRLATSTWSAVVVTIWGLVMMVGGLCYPTSRRGWLVAAGVFPCLVLGCGLAAAAAAAVQPDRVVVVTSATLRAGNGWSYPPATWLGRRPTVADGMVAVVRAEAVNGWRQIRLADGRLGWLPPGVTRKLPR